MTYTRKTSATQINLYNKCPFAYYIQYKLKLKPPLTFALVKGSLLHAVLEKFYDINIRSSGVNKFNYQDEFQKHIFNVLESTLIEKRTRFGKSVPTYKEELKSICSDDFEYAKEISDCKKILRNFVTFYCMQLEQYLDKYGNISQAFYTSKPKFRELDLSLENFYAIADCIPKYSDKLAIDDYKSSTLYDDGFNDEHELQLLLYCYAYWKKNGEMPLKGRIIYLRYGIRCQYKFTEEEVKNCENYINEFLDKTESDNPKMYPLNIYDKFCTCSLSEHPNGKGFKSGFTCGWQEFCNKKIEEGTVVVINNTE